MTFDGMDRLIRALEACAASQGGRKREADNAAVFVGAFDLHELAETMVLAMRDATAEMKKAGSNTRVKHEYAEGEFIDEGSAASVFAAMCDALLRRKPA